MKKNNVKNGAILAMAAVMGLSICAGCGNTAEPEGSAQEAEVSNEQTETEEAATEAESADEQVESETETTEEEVTEAEITEEAPEEKPEYIEDMVISTELMTMTVPDEFEGKFYASVDGEMISIYEKSCVDDGFPGFVFSVVVDKDNSYVPGGMYTKVGELKDSAGTDYDVCVGYASEIQWDYNDPDNVPEYYEKMENSIDTFIQNIKGTDGNVFAYQAGTRGEDLYGDILTKYVNALNEGWDANKFEQEGMSPEFYALIQSEGDKAMDKIGFIYKDVTSDGIDELLLGVINDNDEPSVVYDIYTVVDKVPTLVVSGTARNCYYALEYDGIANAFIGGAEETGVYSYIIYPNSTELGLQYGLKYDSYTDEANPWFITYSDENSWEPMTEADYQDRLDMLTGYYQKLDYTPLPNVTK